MLQSDVSSFLKPNYAVLSFRDSPPIKGLKDRYM